VRASLTVCVLALLTACVSSRPDRFYLLSASPPGAGESRPASGGMPATLKVILPSWADRSEMLLNTSAGEVIVLEHERWAAPLPDLVRQTLGVDIERRRADVTVADRGLNGSKGATLDIAVQVVQMTMHRGERTRIEAHWRIHDPRTATDVYGGGEFTAPLGTGGYASVAQALSDCLGQLADRLVQQMSPAGIAGASQGAAQ
jgi:uncharacterized lipoprotein YmbA